DDRGARYPVRIDPFVQQGSKLLGPGASGGAFLGAGVSVSADGNTALVGGAHDNNDIGAAWVFVRSGSTWTQQGPKLVGTGAVGGAWQGLSVALSADGNTALVGGPKDNHITGATWVFTRSGSTWTQQGPKLVGSGAVVDGTQSLGQGARVALSGDGTTALVSDDDDNGGMGAVWVFTRAESTWSQQGSKLVGTGIVGGGANEGLSVALSGDGNTALLGGFRDNNYVGATWVFTRSGSSWSQLGSKLVGTGGVGATRQGYSVALSGDGSTALIGGPC